MQIEALPSDGGVARAFVNTIEHIRLRDLAEAVPGLQADPRWPSISFFDTAARMFVEHSGIEGVMLHTLPKRGRYVPRDQLQPAIDYLTSSATIAEAQSRTWAGINANRKRRAKAMQPIEIQDVVQSDFGQVRNLNASDLMRPIQFIVTSRGLFLREKDVASSVSGAQSTGYYRQFAATMNDHAIYVGTPGRGHSHRFLHESKIDALLERLQRRDDYDRPVAVRLTRRLEELRGQIGDEIIGATLPGSPDPVQIVGQTIGAGAEALPSIEMISPTPEIERLRREHGHRWVEDSPDSRAEKLAELAKVQADEPNQRKVNAAEIVRRMGLVEASQEAVIERIDAVLAQKDATIAARDRQIAALQELVIDLGHRCVSLLGGIAELKAIASR